MGAGKWEPARSRSPEVLGRPLGAKVRAAASLARSVARLELALFVAVAGTHETAFFLWLDPAPFPLLRSLSLVASWKSRSAGHLTVRATFVPLSAPVPLATALLQSKFLVFPALTALFFLLLLNLKQWGVSGSCLELPTPCFPFLNALVWRPPLH